MTEQVSIFQMLYIINEGILSRKNNIFAKKHLSFLLMVMISGWKTNKHMKRDQVPRIFSGKIYKTFKLSLNENPWCKPTDSFLYQNSTASLKVKSTLFWSFSISLSAYAYFDESFWIGYILILVYMHSRKGKSNKWL